MNSAPPPADLHPHAHHECEGREPNMDNGSPRMSYGVRPQNAVRNTAAECRTDIRPLNVVRSTAVNCCTEYGRRVSY